MTTDNESRSLAASLDEVIVQAMRDGGRARPHLESARRRLNATVTIVVTGRRGSGKTSVVNELVSAPVGAEGHSAEDKPVQLFVAEPEAEPGWATVTLVPPSLMQGRRIVEVPEHLAADPAARTSWTEQLAPDVLVHVSRCSPRRDELDWISHAQGQWSLASLETVWVGPTQCPTAMIAASRADLLVRMESVRRLVETRRCGAVLHLLATLASRSDDRACRGRLADDLEKLSLSPEGHTLRERWALETCLTRQDDVPPALRDQVIQRVLGPRTLHDREALLTLAAHWREQVSVLHPLAAEVARVIARTLYADALATRRVGCPEEVAAS